MNDSNAQDSATVVAFSNIKPSIQFKVDMTTSELVRVDKKTQTLIINILEREYMTRNQQKVSMTSTIAKKKAHDKNESAVEPVVIYCLYSVSE